MYSMKHLLTILLCLFIASPVLAARQVEGTVPDLKPLQPPPEGVFLDYENSLNSPIKEESEDSESVKSLNQNNVNIQSVDQENSGEKSGNNTTIFNKANLKNIFFVIFILAVLLAGIYYLRKGSK